MSNIVERTQNHLQRRFHKESTALTVPQSNTDKLHSPIIAGGVLQLTPTTLIHTFAQVRVTISKLAQRVKDHSKAQQHSGNNCRVIIPQNILTFLSLRQN